MSPRARIWAARGIAAAADAVQILLIPAFFGGAASPIEDAVDVLVGVILVLLLGWHFAFLPSFVAELVPALDLFPNWTTAVLWVTRKKKPLPVPRC